jgi:hypothetical protein
LREGRVYPFWMDFGNLLRRDRRISHIDVFCVGARAGLSVTVMFWKSVEGGTGGFLTTMLSIWGVGRVYP